MYVEMKKIKIIFNPNAHSGKSIELLTKLKSELSKNNITYSILETHKHYDAIELSYNTIEDDDIVVIVGGDGTVHETINGTIGKKNIKYCIVPAGTGNDLYRALKNNFSVKKLIENIQMGTIKKCNTISINNKTKMTLFLAYGITMDIIMRCRKSKKKSRFCYLKAAVKSMFFHKPTQFEYSIEDGEIVKVNADHIGIHNASKAGGGIHISPFSKIDDGEIELVILEYVNVFRRILNILAIVQNRIAKQPNYKSISCQKVYIKSIQDDECCIDGETVRNKVTIAKLDKTSISFLA